MSSHIRVPAGARETPPDHEPRFTRLVRDFVPADQQLLQSLILNGLRDRWGQAFDPTYNSDLDDIQAVYVDSGADVVVVEEERSLVAVGVLVPCDAERARIVRMSVEANHRRRGLGRLVVGELLRRAQARGLREVVVLTDSAWHSAIALYRSCGFVAVGHHDTDTCLTLPL